MKTMLRLALALFTVGTLAVAARPALAATANGPYYAVPSWDQKLQCDTPATCPRFIVLSNWNGEAVLDRETGLVWEQSPSTTQEYWSGAQMSCNRKAVGNRKGWRLPTIQELTSLVDPTVSAPPLPAGHPFSNLQSSFYWSSTTFAPNTSLAWFVSLIAGGVSADDKSSTFFVWCVRGGQGVDPQ